MTENQVREIRRRAYELHLLASESLTMTPLPPVPAPPCGDPLSPMQHTIMRLVAVGRSNPEIAQELRLSDKTVRNQVARAYARLGVEERVMAAQVYRRMCEAPA
jgi:DNA-binding NarL/FixJ family response regulator